MFFATGGEKIAEQQLDKNEEIEIVELSIEELIEHVMAQKIIQAVHVNCIFFALMKMGRLQFSEP